MPRKARQILGIFFVDPSFLRATEIDGNGNGKQTTRVSVAPRSTSRSGQDKEEGGLGAGSGILFYFALMLRRTLCLSCFSRLAIETLNGYRVVIVDSSFVEWCFSFLFLFFTRTKSKGFQHVYPFWAK
ncbi:hypothetical protein QBC43DRAFT_315539 [Cladorrhinum sp. PSN259]|nr:hypothetical protein QBC43DRAFT_315539 [Cladorrhinum sp. PSN259]